MPRVLIIFLDSLIIAFTALYVSSRILNKRLNYRDYSFWIALSIETFYMTFSYLLTDSFIRVIINYLILSIINVLLFKSNVIQSVVISFTTMFLMLSSEIIYMLAISNFITSTEQLKNSFFGDLFSNIAIALIAITIISIKKIRKILNHLMENIKIQSIFIVPVYFFFSLASLSLLLYYIYFEIDILSAGILCLILVVVFSVLTLYLFKEKNENLKLQVEYDILSDNLEEYEKMYQLQRMVNHEIKNELSTIRGLIGKDNKKLKSYVDELIDSKMVTKTKWMDTLKRIPEPTLRGLLYYKLATIESNGIKVDLEISREVTVKNFNKISSDLYKKVCKILGIYLDNAMEAVKDLETKNIRIDFYLEEKESLVISVMNNYEGSIDLSQIEEKGYSTKGIGRGLGLSIAKEIYDKEQDLTNQKEIIKDNFVQRIKIKLKK